MRGVARARLAAAAVHWLTRALLPRGTKLDLEKLSVLVLQMAGVASRPFALCTSSTAQARGARMLAWCTHEIRVQVEAVYPWIDPQNASGYMCAFALITLCLKHGSSSSLCNAALVSETASKVCLQLHPAAKPAQQ
jgi:hypothetical protein